MMNNAIPLMSIIMPCYNGDKYLIAALNSILSQTHTNIELIFVNDGSTDNTDKIFLQYSDKFKDRGYKVIYINKKENKNLAAAINSGLEVFSGDYLTWIDADDYLEPTFIEKHVNLLEQNPEYGFCFSDTCICDLNNNTSYIVHRKPVQGNIHSAIMQILPGKDLFFPYPFCTARRDAILRAIPTRHIYDKGNFYGQNMQLLIPLTYYYNCGVINETLSTYFRRPSSSSTFKYELRLEHYFLMLCHTISNMNIPEGDKLYMLSVISENKSSILLQKELKNIKPRLNTVKIPKILFNSFLFFVPIKKIRRNLRKWNTSL